MKYTEQYKDKKAIENTIDDVLEFSFRYFTETEGNLVPVTSEHDVDFDIKRVFYTWDVPHGELRGQHAHHQCEQVIVCLKGELVVEVDDGVNKKIVTLNSPEKALYIPTGIWAQETYNNEAIMLAFCSNKYAKADYINDYEEFLEWRRS